jgi:deoxyadenosine/deoxycytidine kinase
MGPSHDLAETRPITVEVLGPPGAGKSSLVASLCKYSDGVRQVSVYCRPSNLLPWLWSGVALAPLLVGRAWDRRSLQKDLIWMIRLEASRPILRRKKLRRASMLIFDQGPAYTMVRLHEAATDAERTSLFRRWWDGKLQVWAATLDLLIMLDGPDEVLMNRIRGRAKSHALKGDFEGRAHQILMKERTLYGAIVAELQTRPDMRVMHFDTNQRSIDVIAAQTMASLGFSGPPKSLTNDRSNLGDI